MRKLQVFGTRMTDSIPHRLIRRPQMTFCVTLHSNCFIFCFWSNPRLHSTPWSYFVEAVYRMTLLNSFANRDVFKRAGDAASVDWYTSTIPFPNPLLASLPLGTISTRLAIEGDTLVRKLRHNGMAGSGFDLQSFSVIIGYENIRVNNWHGRPSRSNCGPLFVCGNAYATWRV